MKKVKYSVSLLWKQFRAAEEGVYSESHIELFTCVSASSKEEALGKAIYQSTTKSKVKSLALYVVAEEKEG